ncbi:hypothetical protein AB0O99_00490 [Cellulosimicrobium funkei]|uniref:hypothetical protein n=1 Tax=Cellulosimicrobium funkei TaxID=264251 RepID=UPI003413EF28
MTSIHETVASLAEEVLKCVADSRSVLIYAPNTIGKTRLAQHLKERDPERVVLYNSFVEDTFSWDNERIVFRIDPESELFETIVTQGLDSAIIDNFRAFTSGRIEPRFDFENGETSFGVHKGDDGSVDGIKISRAEESIFVWSVYHSVLSEAIEALSDSPELRSTTNYDQLTLAVIDDPVSSMDDVRIISVALALVDLIKRASDLDLGFVIATHHPLFFNVLFNSLRRNGDRAYILARGPVAGWTLTRQSKDAPFSYHLGVVREIQGAISSNAIGRAHFNQFRALLEKTANFLGHTGGWGDLLVGPHAALMTKVLNLYSHDRFADIDTSEVAEEYKDAFRSEFQVFLKTFRWAAAG